ncbi:MAG: TIM barrel protein [Verrucomicrobiae bacterium]|nr:TIM barrel protein [Verrucomicrobiae bacterium]
MPTPISVQLYSLRNECAKDFIGVLKKVAAIGFKGVEPAGFYGHKIREVHKTIEDLGMVISSSHRPWVTPDNVSESVEIAGILGLDMVCCGFGPDSFKNMDEIRRAADQVNTMHAALKKHGLKLFLHNHWWEYAPVNGRLAIDHFAEMSPNVLFEIDTYWAANFGANDPAEQVAKFKKRAPLLHIKDGTFVKDQPNVALGSGKMNFAKVLPAADPEVLRWLVVEFDSCGSDIFQALTQSHAHLTSLAG